MQPMIVRAGYNDLSKSLHVRKYPIIYGRQRCSVLFLRKGAPRDRKYLVISTLGTEVNFITDDVASWDI